MSTERNEDREEGKRVRVPFGARRLKLQLSEKEARAMKESGYVARWVNDADGRVEQALAGGYEFVKPEEARSVGQAEINEGNTDLAGKVSKIVSRGHPQIRAFLMKVKQEYYDEDQEAKEEVNARVDEALAGGEAGGAGVENAYIPGGHSTAVRYTK